MTKALKAKKNELIGMQAFLGPVKADLSNEIKMENRRSIQSGI